MPAPPPFLRQLSPGDADALIERTQLRRFARSELLVRAGSAGDDVAIVMSGSVRLMADGVDDREVLLAIRGPGELIGEMAALSGQRRTASAVAIDDVEAGFIDSDEFRGYLREHPDAALVLIRALVRRLSDSTRDLVDLATQDSVGRIARRLLDLAPETRLGEHRQSHDHRARPRGAAQALGRPLSSRAGQPLAGWQAGPGQSASVSAGCRRRTGSAAAGTR